MKMARSSVVVHYGLANSFESIRKKLLGEQFADRLEMPLAHWALPNDRRLPLAFMRRSLKDLLETPFDVLFATPGIGEKKINSLVSLLNRAARPQPVGETPVEPREEVQAPVAASEEGVDTSLVSEALWVKWRQAVVDHGLCGETLGRFAPSLQTLPRVLWETRLSTYTERTLTEIRDLKTHGVKRVRNVLEVFGSLYSLLTRLAPAQHLAVRVVPRFVTRLENWVQSCLRSDDAPDAEEVRTALVETLLMQVRCDATEQIARLVEGRLHLRGQAPSVRETARRLGVTRARVYQLLGDAAAVIQIRWPEGPAILADLRNQWRRQGFADAQFKLFDDTLRLFFPNTQTAAATATGDTEAFEPDLELAAGAV
jgi:hypothetical protein